MTSNPKQKPSVTVPFSKEAERSVIAGLLSYNKVWDDISDMLMDSDFYVPEHGFIYKAMQELANQNKPFDVLTVTDQLKQTGNLDKAGGESSLYSIANDLTSVANLKAYAAIVRDRSLLRKLLDAGHDITLLAGAPEGRSPEEVIDQAEQCILAISDNRQTSKGPLSVKELVPKATQRIDDLSKQDNPVTGLASGLKDLDTFTTGFHKGDLVILAGRPSMGKTSFAMNIAESAAISQQKTVLVFSLEMPGDMLVTRMLSSLGRIDQHRVRTGQLQDDDWPRLSSAVNMISESPLFIDDFPGLSPMELRARARRLKRQEKSLGLIVVDYLQLMRIPGFKEGRTQEISEISRSLKVVAKELEVPVIALSQLNRSLEQRQDRRPVMSDLRESGAIEQDADIIAFIYRDEVYNDQSPDKGIAEIIIAKQRNGPIGKVRTSFLGQYTRFENYTADTAFVE
ncbi:MAG TPA: replicative DNA helicase [Gammaproteobacteria bacterium]|nr:replicative DNA helicase [Gammaproteobacteria bacterium]